MTFSAPGVPEALVVYLSFYVFRRERTSMMAPNASMMEPQMIFGFMPEEAAYVGLFHVNTP